MTQGTKSNKGEILKKIREYLQLSQNAMGENLGCSGTQIRRYEKGKLEITDELERLVCEKFSLSRDVFEQSGFDGESVVVLQARQMAADDKIQSDKESIGRRVYELRKSLDLSQEDFGKACGYSLMTVCNIENATIKPSDKSLKDISNAFGVGYEWLKFGDETQKEYPVNDVLLEWIKSNPKVRKMLWEKMRK